MRKELESERDRNERIDLDAQARIEDAAAERTRSTPPLGEPLSCTVPERPRRKVVQDSGRPKDTNFTVFRSAAKEADMKCAEQSRDDEGGHMSSTAGRVMRKPGAKLPYIVTLTHHLSEASRHSFATMREAEAFIKRNTPVPGAVLSPIYDRPAPEPQLSLADTESIMNDESILSRLKVIDQRLRQISAEEAASVLAGGLASAGIREHERLRLVAETERILDELDGKNND
jgi:hypothetical protein